MAEDLFWATFWGVAAVGWVTAGVVLEAEGVGARDTAACFEGGGWGWGVCDWICLSMLGLADVCVEAGARRTGACLGPNFLFDLSGKN